jgi:hypothetical protein
MMATPLLFAGVTAVAAPPRDMRSPEMSGLFLWMSAAVVGIGLAVARVVPPRIGARHQGSREALAFVRLAVTWGVLEGAAMFPLVANLVTGSPLLYVPGAVALLALAGLYPSEARWSGQAVPAPSGSGAARGGRP